MKRNLFAALVGVAFLGSSSVALAADGAKIYAAKCANCHGKDGKAETKMGKEKGAKDFATSKASVDEIIKVATEGKKKEDGKAGSPAFKDKLSADDIKAVSEYVKTTFIK